jgi:hypothetical protein
MALPRLAYIRLTACRSAGVIADQAVVGRAPGAAAGEPCDGKRRKSSSGGSFPNTSS